MMRFVYSDKKGGVHIIIPVSKQDIERSMGPLSEEEYITHVLDRAVPKDAINLRPIKLEDLPEDREFRDAWVDTTDKACIDICCEKAQKLVLEKLRFKREPKLLEQDKKLMKALRLGEDTTELKKETQALLDITEPVKALKVKGKVNTKTILNKLRAELKKVED